MILTWSEILFIKPQIFSFGEIVGDFVDQKYSSSTKKARENDYSMHSVCPATVLQRYHEGQLEGFCSQMKWNPSLQFLVV